MGLRRADVLSHVDPGSIGTSLVGSCTAELYAVSNSTIKVPAPRQTASAAVGGPMINLAPPFTWDGVSDLVLGVNCAGGGSAWALPASTDVRTNGWTAVRLWTGAEGGLRDATGAPERSMRLFQGLPGVRLCSPDPPAPQEVRPWEHEPSHGPANVAEDEEDDDAPHREENFIAVLTPSPSAFNHDAQPLFTPGHHYLIRWVSRGDLGSIRVELHRRHLNGASSFWVISEGVPDDGVWDWFLPQAAFADGGNYRLRLVSSRRPHVWGESGSFAIRSGHLIYVSWVLLMVAMLGTMCCSISVCKAVRQARMELRRAERAHGRSQRARDRRRGGDDDEEDDDDEDDGEEGETEDEGDDEDVEEAAVVEEWRPATPPEEQLASVSISRFQCCICMEHAIDTVIVPCGHQVACGRCAHGCSTCPICRADIERIVKVFHK